MPSEAELRRFEEEYYPATAAYRVDVRLHPDSFDLLKTLSPSYQLGDNPDHHLRIAQVLLFAVTGLIEGLWQKALIKPLKQWEVRVVRGEVIVDLAGNRSVTVPQRFMSGFHPAAHDWTQQVHIQVQALGGEQLPLDIRSARPSLPSLKHAETLFSPKSDEAMIWFNPAVRVGSQGHGHEVICKTHTFRAINYGSVVDPTPNTPSVPIFQFLFHHEEGAVRNGRELFRMRWHAPEWAHRRRLQAQEVAEAVLKRFMLKSDTMFDDSPEALHFVFQTSVFEVMPRSHFSDA